MTTTPLADLWHRAGRAARDNRKRLLTLYGVLLSGPVLVLGAVLDRVVRTGGPDLPALRRPLAYVLDPVVSAWRSDADLALVGYLLLQGVLLHLLWGFYGGAVARMAAVHLATGLKEDPRSAIAFARRHYRAFAGAPAAFWVGTLGPILLAVLLASAGRLPAPWGGLALAVAVVGIVALVLAALVVGSVGALAGFLTMPTVACEDSDAFDGVSRAFEYTGAGPPRLLAVRLAFLGGVAIGTLWRGAKVLLAILLAVVVLRAGAGEDAFRRVFAILANVGAPPDALRLGVTWGDAVAAGALALVAGGLVALWAADLASRLLCARVGAYLYLRQAIDRVPVDALRTLPPPSERMDAESAGFVEVARIAPSGPSRGAR
jgi:hypothetical protein